MVKKKKNTQQKATPNHFCSLGKNVFHNHPVFFLQLIKLP